MGKKNNTYPNTWLSGPDPIDHKLFNDCQRARAQAWYRGEDWFISEHEYIQLWREGDRYQRKGRTTNSLCMIRLDIEAAWTLDNVTIAERHQHFRQVHIHKKLKRQMANV
jgi:hypothetical protein